MTEKYITQPSEMNTLGQPLDVEVPDWTVRPRPPRTAIEGQYCSVAPLNADADGPELYEAVLADTDGFNWTYLPYGPFETYDGFEAWLHKTCLGDDPLFHTVRLKETGKAVGVASLMRIDPAMGVIETGHIHYSPLLQRTPASTEAMYLLMRRVFDELGYRRYEWKCNNLNEPSKNAAERLGFTYEGVFRQLGIYKGRNRDTAWFSILDREWPIAKAAFEEWLNPANFDDDGTQRQSLVDIRTSLRQKS